MKAPYAKQRAQVQAIKHAKDADGKKSNKLPWRGAIYARTNKRGQKSSWNSLPIQVRLCKKQMKQDGVKEVRSPILEVASGMDFSRKGIEELLKLAKQNRIDHVYVHTLDRLGRDVVKTIYFINQLKGLGVVIRTIS